MEDFPESHRQAWIGIAVLVVVGGTITVLMGGAIGCGTTDGSFDLDANGANPSRYCELTHFPGIPDSLGSAGLVTALSLVPALLALGGLGGWALTGKAGAYRVGLAFALLAVVALFIFTGLNAEVGFEARV